MCPYCWSSIAEERRAAIVSYKTVSTFQWCITVMSKRHLVSFTGKSSKMLWNVMIVIWLEQFDLCTQSQNLTTVMKCLSFAFSCHNYSFFFWPSFFSFQMDVSQKCRRSFPVTTLSLFIIVTLLNSWLTSTAFSMRSHPWTQRT